MREPSVFADGRLLERSVLGGLDHLLVGGNEDLDATVLGAAFSRGVVSDRVIEGHAVGLDAGSRNAALLQIGGNGFGALDGDALIDGGGAGVVRVAEHGDVRLGKVRHLRGEFFQLGLGGGVEGRAVGREEDTAVESDLDGFQAVVVRHLLDLGILKGGQFSGLLVHLVADERAGAAADSRTDGSTDGSAFGVFADQAADDRAEGCTAAGSDQGVFGEVGHVTASGKEDQGAKRHCNVLFHII